MSVSDFLYLYVLKLRIGKVPQMGIIRSRDCGILHFRRRSVGAFDLYRSPLGRSISGHVYCLDAIL